MKVHDREHVQLHVTKGTLLYPDREPTRDRSRDQMKTEVDCGLCISDVNQSEAENLVDGMTK